MSTSPSNPEDRRVIEPRLTEPVTLKTLKRLKARAERFACLACYDATTAKLLHKAGVHVLLAGDSAAQVVLGFDRTISMPIDFAIQITAAIKRGAPDALIMADMPFLSYHTSVDTAMNNAGRFMTEGNADVIKLEADETFAPLIDRMTRAGIPICAHIGCKPQTSSVTGGPVAAGRTADQLQQVVNDAVALEQAGAVLILVEAVPPEVARAVMDAVSVPVIGIGAGNDCDGQILVVNDLLGMTEHPPRFAEPAADLSTAIYNAGVTWVQRINNGQIGGVHYTMRDEKADKKDAKQENASGRPGSAKH
ncbi:MAG: 3-methyl-2-oxobutanoate hydroxymethyltransferase [Phycisphaerales bacterium]|nr:3-methyl-2-oxobutanoate hydroxymethyltransferase [Phycisphaerales bacterium]